MDLDPTGRSTEFLRKRSFQLKDHLRKLVRKYNEHTRATNDLDWRILRAESRLNDIELELGTR